MFANRRQGSRWPSLKPGRLFITYNAGYEVAVREAALTVITPEEVRQLALSLPEVEERETRGYPTFRVRNKIFVTLSASDRTASFKTSLENQEELIALDPETFRVASYTGRFGWTRVQLSRVDHDLMRELVIEAWRRIVPKRLVAAYDAQR
jgi:hypothetical protein